MGFWGPWVAVLLAGISLSTGQTDRCELTEVKVKTATAHEYKTDRDHCFRAKRRSL